MDPSKSWFTFLAVVIIERCEIRLKEDCAGCKNGLLASILHYHTRFNLLETIKKYSETVALEMDIQKVYNSFLIQFGNFDLPQDEFIQQGQAFVRFSTPEAIYYGNYITKDNQESLYTETISEDTTSYEPIPMVQTKITYEPTPIQTKPKKRKYSRKEVIEEKTLSGGESD